MRIVAGTMRGRTIEAPEGENTRPTIDRVREALFSSLYSMRGGFEDAVALDAFAGSGALGLEAMSRGAATAVFYEAAPKAFAVLKRNIAACGLSEPEARAVKRDVLAAPPTTQAPAFDLVLLDPPYDYDAVEVLSMVARLRDAGSLSNEAIVVYEHNAKAAGIVEQAAASTGFACHAARKYGKTGITILKPEERSVS